MNEAVNKKILVLYTGGTIGMTRKTPDGPWSPDRLKSLLKNIPQIHQVPYDVIFEEFYLDKKTPIDSSNANYPLYNALAKKIGRDYKRYDGFVIVYGTDTMAPSAGALSYLLEGLNKPVVFTGSMIPACEADSDGPQNVIDAIRVAGESGVTIPAFGEVLMVFNGAILRAATVRKYSASALDAFDTPEHMPLGKISDAGSIQIDAVQLNLERTEHTDIKIHELEIDSAPAVIYTHPMEEPLFRNLVEVSLGDNPKGVVITGMELNEQSYMLPILQEMIPRDIPVFYAVGNESPDTSWAKLDGLNDFQQVMIKAAYAISRTDNPEIAKAIYAANIRGEGYGPIVLESEVIKKSESVSEHRGEFDGR